jgi:uncharacterized protein YajQ (UPF0234 family)
VADPSFDIVSKVDRQEVDNALNQTAKEASQRYDFKGVGADIAWSGETIVLKANSEERVKALLDVFKEKLIKRQISLKTLDAGEPMASGKEFRLVATVNEGISSENAKKVAKVIRDEGPRASSRRSRTTSCGCRPRRRTTCRPSSRCSRARSSTSPCSSPTTAEPAPGPRRSLTVPAAGDGPPAVRDQPGRSDVGRRRDDL